MKFMGNHILKYVLFIVLLLPISAWGQTQLLTNRGAEDGSGSLDGTLEGDWINSTGGAFDEVSQTKSFTPDAQSGSIMFFENSSNNLATYIEQTVDVSGWAGSIDAGDATVDFSGWLRTNSLDADKGKFTVTFLDGSNTDIESFDSGFLESDGAWQQVSDSRTVPSGTRSVRLRLHSQNEDQNDSGDATFHNVFFDNMSLIIQDANAGPTTIYVDTDATGANNGTSWANAYTSLQNALDQATDNDQIWIAEGTYYPDEGTNVSEGDQNASFTITGDQDGLKIYGGFDGTESQLDQRDISGHRTILSGDIAQDDDPFAPNTDSDGDPDTFSGTDHINGTNSNHVLFIDGDSNDSITNATLFDGLTVTAGQAKGNDPEKHGGGLLCWGEGASSECSPTLNRLIFVGNTAIEPYGNGGAIYNSGAKNLIINNTIFYRNSTSGEYGKGGAMTNFSENNPTVTNTIFVANRVSGQNGNGGAIFNDGLNAKPVITNTIFYENVANGGNNNIYNMTMATATISHSLIEGSGGSSNWNSDLGTDGGGNIDANPQFVNTSNPGGVDGMWFTDDDGFSLQASSPAINAGDNDAIPSGINTDIAGNTRIRGNTVDMGVYESTVASNPPVFTSSSSATVDENFTGIVLDVNANDGDGGGNDVNINYNFTGGGDAPLFQINSTTGEISLDVPGDFENPNDNNADNNYELEVTAGDGDGYTDQHITITVTDVNESPTVANAISDLTVDEDAANETYDLTNVFSDPEDNSSDLTFSVQGNDNSGLVNASVDNSTDQLTLDYHSNQSGTANITIRAEDSGDQTMDDSFTITVNPVAETFYVNRNATGSNNGSSWNNAFQYLQDALAAAGGEDQIWIAEGIYYPDEGTNVTANDETAYFTITGDQDGLKIYGGFDGTETQLSDRDISGHRTILSGDIAQDDDPFAPNTDSDGDSNTFSGTDHINGTNSNHVLFIDGDSNGSITNTTLFDGLTVTAGQAKGNDPEKHGGGLFCEGVGSGSECSPTLNRLIFKGNTAIGSYGHGGAIYINRTSSSIISNTIFYSNNVSEEYSEGGAIKMSGGDASVELLIINSVFINNRASGPNGDGGAISNQGTDTNTAISNTIFYDNHAERNGNHIHNQEISLSVHHSLIESGTAGVYNFLGDETTYLDENGNSVSFANSTNIDANPQFVDASNPAGADGTWFTADDGLVLQPVSPAIDAGDNDAIFSGISTDIAGNARTRGGTVDMGVYEATPNGPPSFVSGPISVSIDEHSSAGTAIADIDATDGDGGAADNNVTFDITGGNPDYNSDGTAAFAIDSNTGEITVDDAADVDYEGGNSVTLTIEATDDVGLTASESADVTINDIAETFVVDGDSQDSFDGKSEAEERADGGGLDVYEAIGLAQVESSSRDTIRIEEPQTSSEQIFVSGKPRQVNAVLEVASGVTRTGTNGAYIFSADGSSFEKIINNGDLKQGQGSSVDPTLAFYIQNTTLANGFENNGLIRNDYGAPKNQLILIDNASTIAGDIINTGTMAGAAVGFDIRTSVDGNFINSGTISADSYGVYLAQEVDGDVTNSGTMTSVGNALRIDGTISGTLVNESGGTLESSANVALQLGSANHTVTNRGDITGGSGIAVNLGDGDDTFTAESGIITGIIEGGAGNDILNGRNADEELDGGLGDDIIRPGEGVDTITLGDGADEVIGSESELNGDTITDIAEGNSVLLKGYTGLSYPGTVRKNNGQLEIDVSQNGFGGSDDIIIKADGIKDVYIDVQDEKQDTRTRFLTNDGPILSDIDDQTVTKDGASLSVSYSVSDPNTDLSKIDVTATSDNQSLFPDQNLALTGSGSDRTIELQPNPGKNGTATVTLVASDGSKRYHLTFDVTVDIKVPEKIVLTAPKDKTEDVSVTPTLEWKSQSDIDTYEIQLATENSFEKDEIIISKTSITKPNLQIDEKLDREASYYWRVRGTNAGGNGEWSSKYQFATLPVLPPQVTLSSPSNESGSITLDGTLTWESLDEADSYEIEIATDEHFSEIKVQEKGLTSADFSLDGYLNNNRVYYWRVRGINSAGSGPWAESWRFVTTAAAPELSFPANNEEQISIAPELSWQSQQEKSTYRVQLGTDNQLQSIVLDTLVEGVSLNLQGLDTETEYFWQVRIENNLTTSPYSKVRTFMTRIPPKNNIQEEQITFGDGNNSGNERSLRANDYRLVGLPGRKEVSVDELFDGEYGTDWKVFSDNGNAKNYLEEYSSDNPFSFTEGRGYWVLSEKPITLGGNIDPVQISEEDTYSLNLKPGWNIITNPFGSVIKWEQVQIYNQQNIMLFGYEESFFESDELAPFHAYYVHNDNDQNLELEIPYTSLEKRTNNEEQKQLAKSKSLSGEIALDIHIEDSKQPARVHMIYDQDVDQRKAYTQYMPPLKLSKFGATIVDEQKSAREKMLHTIGDTYDRDRKQYTVEIKATTRKKIEWSPNISGFTTEMAVLVIEPDKGRSKILSDGESYTFMAAKGRKQFEVYTGSVDELKEVQENMLPEQVKLNKNYPNPFNLTTTIQFGIEKQSDVILEVYNILGQKVQTLVNGSMKAGWHKIRFNGSRLASGTYFYRLIVGQKVQTKKMVLIK
ncbi:cadherin domain-containing protein [Fodinibius sp. Rm-B-1B1-1]|uniref:cadherin domain-containing protein n=1 Tax=Fodinibius alkaliphilus TaxID=3140241 RepID=UPI003159B3C1